jgi:hypothetical protein
MVETAVLEVMAVAEVVGAAPWAALVVVKVEMVVEAEMD